jgi:hypothetical protein
VNLGPSDKKVSRLSVSSVSVLAYDSVVPLTHLLGTVIVVFSNLVKLLLKAFYQIVQSFLHRKELIHQKRSEDTEVSASQEGVD